MANWSEYPSDMLLWRGGHNVCVGIVIVLSVLNLPPLTEARNHYRVTSVLMEPYLMIDPKNANHTGNEQFMGYIPDLMYELSQRVGFHYRIHVVEDGQYGSRQPDGSWDGMIGELQTDRADIAAAPLYITKQRKRAVSFSKPFMHVHATVLLSKYQKYPGISTAKDLIGQSKIQYGTLNTGILVHAFIHSNDSAYQTMWKNMKDRVPSVLTASNNDGIDRVRKGGYAFILPSTIGEYISKQTHCDLKTLNRFLMNKEFALAVYKKSEKMKHMLEDFDTGLDILRDSGKLQQIYNKWWFTKNNCGSIKTSSAVSQGQYTSTASPTSQNLLLTASFCLLMVYFVSGLR